jgi:hypothetical protein
MKLEVERSIIAPVAYDDCKMSPEQQSHRSCSSIENLANERRCLQSIYCDGYLPRIQDMRRYVTLEEEKILLPKHW